MNRWSLVLLLFVSLLFIRLNQLPVRAAELTVTTISGGDLPQAVRLAPSDDDAFRRRINSPPRLDARPDRATGATLQITSDYWATFLDRPGRSPVEQAATYYVESGIVRARQGGSDLWLALDLRQQAIIDRYARLARQAAIPARPGALSVIAAAAQSEDITLEVSGKQVSGAEVASIWSALQRLDAPRFVDTGQAPQDETGAFWLVFGLPEGRSVQFLFRGGSPASLSDVFGVEQYSVPVDLASRLTAMATEIPFLGDANGPGTKLWWLILGAAGLACLAAAVWFTRHPWYPPIISRWPRRSDDA